MAKQTKNNFLAKVLTINLNSYLQSLQIFPLGLAEEADHWYYQAAFKTQKEVATLFIVNEGRNTWKAPLSKIGGNIIDFGVYYFNISAAAFLQQLYDQYPLPDHEPDCTILDERLALSQITQVRQRDGIDDPALQQFLIDFDIPLQTTLTIFKVYDFVCQDLPRQGFGLRSLSGAYHMFDPLGGEFAESYEPIFIDHQSATIEVFSNAIDLFFSLAELKDTGRINHNIIVLPSVFYFERYRPLLEQHHRILLNFGSDSPDYQFIAYGLWLDQRYEEGGFHLFF